MKLSSDAKTHLVNAAIQTYKGYMALDFFKSTLLDDVVKGQTTKDYHVTRNGSDDSFQVTVKNVKGLLAPEKVPPIADYIKNPALALHNQTFNIHRDEQGKFHVSQTLVGRNGQNYVIGGKEKIDLYREHLLTLFNIIQQINQSEDVANLLVALATGSGKTFVQALWILVLTLSNMSGVMGVPDKLIVQMMRDLERLLPMNLLENLHCVRNDPNLTSSCAEKALKDLCSGTSLPQIILVSSEALLDKHYHELIAHANPNNTFLSFDEQHLLMQVERRRVRLGALAEKFLSVFLTATPTEESYELSGQKPVAIMSSGQKEKAGQGQFPILLQQNAVSVNERDRSSFSFWENLRYDFMLNLAQVIEPEPNSAALSLVENLPFLYHVREDIADKRWALQVPMARKMLCILDDNESLINFVRGVRAKNCKGKLISQEKIEAYHNGNIVQREKVAEFFLMDDLDVEIKKADLEQKKKKQIEAFEAAGLDRQIVTNLHDSKSKSAIQKRMENTVFHNMLEYVLCDITGLDEIEHNKFRKENKLIDLVSKKLQENPTRPSGYFRIKLERLLDPDGALKIGMILNGLFNDLKELSSSSETRYHEAVDNWNLNDGIVSLMLDRLSSEQGSFKDSAESYLENHHVLYLFSNMENAETPIAESKPFWGFNQETYTIYDSNNKLNEKAKKRKHTILESLDPDAKESRLLPIYDKKDKLTEEIADNYFRLGFVGAYVSNKKTEGFSDRNLHTVINIAEHTLSTNNDYPSGRPNRGLDNNVTPIYIHALGRGQESLFDLNHLKKDDFYPDLFKAKQRFNNGFIDALGGSVGEQIIAGLQQNTRKDGSIDEEALEEHSLRVIAQALRQLNNHNNHDIVLSRQQLKRSIVAAMNTINQEIARAKEPYFAPLSTRIIGSLLYGLATTYYFFKNMISNAQARWYILTKGNEEEALYVKILNNTSFTELTEKFSSLYEFHHWMKQAKSSIKTIAENKVEDFLKEKEVLGKYRVDLLLPLLKNMVKPELWEKVEQAISSQPIY